MEEGEAGRSREEDRGARMSREEQKKHERAEKAGRGKENLVLLVAGLVFLGSEVVLLITILLLLPVAALLA